MRFEIAKCFLEVCMQFLCAHTADDATAGAIAAVTGTAIRNQKQNTVGIPMYQPRYWHVRIFAARIHHVVRGRPCLLDPRNHLTSDWILGIAARHDIKKVGSDRERELVA